MYRIQQGDVYSQFSRRGTEKAFGVFAGAPSHALCMKKCEKKPSTTRHQGPAHSTERVPQCPLGPTLPNPLPRWPWVWRHKVKHLPSAGALTRRQRCRRRLHGRAGTARPPWRRRGQQQGNKDVRCTDGVPVLPADYAQHLLVTTVGECDDFDETTRLDRVCVSVQGLERNQNR